MNITTNQRTFRHTYVAACGHPLVEPCNIDMQGIGRKLTAIAVSDAIGLSGGTNSNTGSIYINFIHYFSGLKRGSGVIAALLLSLWLALPASAQFAVKTNLLYDATTTPNISAEVGVGGKNTLQLTYGLNPWEFHTKRGEKMAKHWMLMPEFRRWSCSKFNGQFFGVHIFGGQLNAANVDLPLPGFFFKGDNMRRGVRDARYEAAFAGIGATYGWQWILSRHWNAEAEIGAGYAYARYDKYPCYECGARLAKGHTNYAGITKIGLSILYIF